MSIVVKHLSKSFGHFKAVDDVSFEIETGALTALLGPSGSGKSTILRMIAGLEIPNQGEIHLVQEEMTFQSARDRKVGFVFQHYALFKHMSVWENVAFGLKVRKQPVREIRERVAEMIRLVQLEGLEDRFPHQLSGGQRQRVALARALAPWPKVLLLDEPFGALDAKVREELRHWIKRLHEQSQITTLFVTHDQHEALEIAEKILVVHRGKVEQMGAPLDIFDHPASPFVAEFVGESNYIEAPVCEPELVCWGPFRFSLDEKYKVGQAMRLYFRPNDVYVTTHPETLQVPAKIVGMYFRGPIMELHLDVGTTQPVIAHVPKGLSFASGFTVGQIVYVGITAFQAFPI